MGKIVCFIGHRKVPDTPELRTFTKDLIKRLITVDNVDTFLFGSRSEFNALCLEIVTEMKEEYPHIKRVKYRTDYPTIPNYLHRYFYDDFEENIFREKLLHACSSAYVERNQLMIDDSDYCVFYYDEKYIPKQRSSMHTPTPSGTALAYHYAEKKKKRIFNVKRE